MPGTIQVSVLEFQSSSSSSPPSSMSLKVSIGKRDYQTWDNGDFYFPLTTLRDNLVVTLQDADGNKVAHTGVRTMSIVEKGSWDDIFSFEEGGHVRMKLQFILSEEDRTRIRTMRESAMKKKQISKATSLTESSLIRVGEKVSDSNTGIVPKVVTSEDVAVSNPPLIDPFPGIKNEESLYRDALPNAIDRSEGASPAAKIHRTEEPLPEAKSPEIHGDEVPPDGNQRESVNILEIPVPRVNVQLKPLSGQEGSSTMQQNSASESPFKRNPIFTKCEDLDKSERRGPVAKTPSKVKKMISAFEIIPDQDPNSARKAPILKTQENKVGKEAPVKDVITPAETNSKGLKNPSPFQKSSSLASISSESIASDKDFARNEPSLARKKLTDSAMTINASEGKDIDTKSIFSEENQLLNMKEEVKSPVDMLIPSTCDTTPSSKKNHEEDSEINIDVALNARSNSVTSNDKEHNPFDNRNMWIFPNNNGHLCITTAGEEVIDLLGETESKTHPECSSTPENTIRGSFSHGENMKKNDQNFFHNLRKSMSGRSPDDAPNGLVGQVIKIAIVAGFGILVLLTRQREPRKNSKKEANDRFFTSKDYMDEHISI